MTVLIIAEHNNKELKSSTLKTVAAAQQLGKEISGLIAGYQCDGVVEQLKKVGAISKIYVADHNVYEHPLAENLSELVLSVIQNATFSHLLGPATTFGKNLMPRIAGMLNTGQVSDVIKILDERTYLRPTYAGNALETVRNHDALQVLTIRPTAYESAINGTQVAEVITCDFLPKNNLSQYLTTEVHASNQADLMTAQVVISGGRGLQSKENFERLAKVAASMGAAIGASRAAVDAGFAPNDYQVGQTGKVVAPKLYIAMGISGAIQHLAGMKDSKVIIAINKDPDCPIFQVADYSLVADVLDILSKWENILRKGE